jgi:hypothetical protein
VAVAVLARQAHLLRQTTPEMAVMELHPLFLVRL